MRSYQGMVRFCVQFCVCAYVCWFTCVCMMAYLELFSQMLVEKGRFLCLALSIFWVFREVFEMPSMPYHAPKGCQDCDKPLGQPISWKCNPKPLLGAVLHTDYLLVCSVINNVREKKEALFEYRTRFDIKKKIVKFYTHKKKEETADLRKRYYREQ